MNLSGFSRRHWMQRFCLPIWLVLAASAWCQSTPRWAERYRANPSAAWERWQNALQPQGEGHILNLAVAGNTDCVIVLPEQPTRLEQRAADELQLWLGEITGAEFTIVPDTTPAQERELNVGRTNRVPAALLDGIPREGYRLAVAGERLFLLGGEQGGALVAVLAFLEEDLGVRWYGPAIPQGSWDELTRALNAKRWPVGEVRVPRQPDLRPAIVPRTAEPAFPLRHLSWQRSYNPWALRNRVNGGYVHQYGQHSYATGGLFVHTYHRLVPPKEHFEQHPEYYSLVGGKRRWEQAQICLTNPAVAAIAARTAAVTLRAIPESQRPNRYLVDVSAEDWLGDCECEQCKALEAETGTYSGVALTFVNRIAELLADEFPWATVTTLAYRQSKTPPTRDIAAHPQVAVRFCTDFGASFNWPYHSFYDDHMAELAEQRGWFERWQQLSPRMHLWIYPHQYRNHLAPMPSIRAVADNLRYFAERNAESVYVQQSIGVDQGREIMRYWLFAKLMWNPALDIEDLIRDFVWGYYGEAAPAVFAYEQFLLDHHLRHTDFARKRNWIYPIHDEPMYRNGFLPEAREILGRAVTMAEDDASRRRVELLLAGVVFVDSAQLYIQMRDSQTPPDAERYADVRREFAQLAERTGIRRVGFFDGVRTIDTVPEWLDELAAERTRRFDQRFLPAEAWGEWRFRKDPDNQGLDAGWQRLPPGDNEGWQAVAVPAFLAQSEVGPYLGFGWYRTTFELTEEQARNPVELQFGGVDEQGWLYVNGEYVGEHTLESEFMVGQEVTVADLWNRPFARVVPAEHLRPGSNVLTVRIHASQHNAGIHQPVRMWLRSSYHAASDGAIFAEDFDDLPVGGLPEAWKRYIQPNDRGGFHGAAGISDYFFANRTLHLQDQRSHVAVWSAADDVLPADHHWAVQFDFRLVGALTFKASPKGAIFGLKQGERRSGAFLPLVHLDNNEEAGKPVALLALGHELATDLPAHQWHRLVVQREGTTWRFFLNDELRHTATDLESDYRAYAFGSFLDWQHRAQDIHYDNLRIGRFAGRRGK